MNKSIKHSFNIERDAEPKNPFGAKLYWKFVVNQGLDMVKF